MLITYPGGKTASGPIDPLESWWLDLIDPTDEEKDAAESICRFTIPSRQELSSIETSSRISEDDGILYLSMPIISSAANVDELLPPRLRAFQGLSRHRPLYGIALVRCRGNKVFQAGSSEDRRGNVHGPRRRDGRPERGHSRSDRWRARRHSRSLFPKRNKKRQRLVSKSNDALRGVLIDVGDIGERSSRARDILLGLQRIVPFVGGPHREWISEQTQEHLRTVSTDIVSLTDYEEHLAGKVQFLLDAVLGLINTKQNDIFTVLPVVSVVGIPPTLVASIYGMNFKNMPELSWAYGYQWGLALVALSTILPILWFKWRGWL